jgi:hypothetical protein
LCLKQGQVDPPTLHFFTLRDGSLPRNASGQFFVRTSALARQLCDRVSARAAGTP